MQPATTYAAVVGQVLKSMREGKNLHQSDLANILGITQATLSRVESGSVGVSMGTIAQLAAALSTQPNVIINTADQIAEQLRKQGVVVENQEPDTWGDDLILIGGAAIAAIALSILFGKE